MSRLALQGPRQTLYVAQSEQTINLDKTKLMLYATKNMQKRANFPDIILSGMKNQYVRQSNYLGVRLDNRLTFESHANECIRLVSQNPFIN